MEVHIRFKSSRFGKCLPQNFNVQLLRCCDELEIELNSKLKKNLDDLYELHGVNAVLGNFHGIVYNHTARPEIEITHTMIIAEGTLLLNEVS